MTLVRVMWPTTIPSCRGVSELLEQNFDIVRTVSTDALCWTPLQCSNLTWSIDIGMPLLKWFGLQDGTESENARAQTDLPDDERRSRSLTVEAMRAGAAGLSAEEKPRPRNYSCDEIRKGSASRAINKCLVEGSS